MKMQNGDVYGYKYDERYTTKWTDLWIDETKGFHKCFFPIHLIALWLQ